MGTSLSGLTPATTFDGLLKTSDNDALDATLKTIGTGDGTDSVLQLSNSALQVNGPTTINGAQMTIVGAGSDALTTSLLVQNSLGTDAFKIGDDRKVFTYADTTINGVFFGNTINSYKTLYSFGSEIFRGSGSASVGTTSLAGSTRFHIKGSGATSATTSLLVQNSAGANLLQANDDGVVLIGPENTYKNHLLELKGDGSNAELLLRLQSSYNGAGGYTGVAFTNSTNGSGISSSIRAYRESDHYALALNFGSNAGTDVLRAKSTGEVGIGETAPTARLHVKGSGNSAATVSFLVQDVNGNNAMRITDNKISRFYGIGYFDSTIYGSGNLSAGSTTIPASTRAYIKGSGATSATTALLVQNSAGSDMFKVADNGLVNIIGTDNDYNTVNFQIERSTGESIFRARNRGALEIGSGIDWISLNSSSNGVRLNVSNSEIARIAASGVGIGESTPTARLQVKGSGNDATTTALLVQNSDGTEIINVSDNGIIGLNPSDSGAKWELNAANNYILSNVYAHYYDTAGTVNFRNANVLLGLGTNAAPNTRVLIKGTGATTATTALLVENSAGTDLLKIDDGRGIYLNGAAAGININAGGLQLKAYNTTVLLVDGPRNQANTPSGIPFGVGTSSVNDASAVLQADSTTQGFLPPRMTTTQRDAIATPAAGLMIYNTTTNKAQCYNGTIWSDLF